jgi:hypothetical protein
VREPIAVGDVVTIRDAKVDTYRNAYGHEVTKPRIVVQDDVGSGRRRLHLDGPPTLLWIGDAKLVMRKQEREKAEKART